MSKRILIAASTALILIVGLGFWAAIPYVAPQTASTWPEEAWAEAAPAPASQEADTQSGDQLTGTARTNAIRESYRRAFGREVTGPELRFWAGRPVTDSRVKSLDSLVAAHRYYLKINAKERSASAMRAVKAALGGSTVPSYHFDQANQQGLIYTEMFRKVLTIESYLRAFGRYPNDGEVKYWAGVNDSRVSNLTNFVNAHRNWLKSSAQERQEMVKRLFQNLHRRQPSSAELTRWDKEIAATGKTYTELIPVIQQEKGGGSGGQTAPPKVTRPRAPRNVKAVANSSTSLTIAWNQVGEGVQSYRVDLWTGREWKPLRTINASHGRDGTGFSFQETGLPAGAGRTYQVCAVNGAGDACANYVGIQLPKPSPPKAPRNVTVKAESSSSVYMTWVQVGTDVKSFRIDLWNGRVWKPLTTVVSKGIDGGSYWMRDSNLSAGQGRTYQVCALNDAGQTCANYVGVKTLTSPPQNVRVIGANRTQLKVSWTANAPVNIYRVAGGRHKMASLGAATREAIVSVADLTDPSYVIEVCAVDGGQESCANRVTIGRQFDHPINFKDLDYGIYWFRCGDCRASDRSGDKGKQSDGVKAVPGLPLEYFDPARPTLIYVHGWEQDTTKDLFRESLKSPNTGEDMLKHWKDRGWNVGIFYWNQFSDDDWGKVPRDAETKIWTADHYPKMRWKKLKGTNDWEWGSYELKKTAPELFVDSYLDAMKSYRGNEVRILGHSLGNQMAVRFTKLLSDRNPAQHLIPKRVALVDPYYTQDKRDWLGWQRTGDRIGEYVAELKRTRNIVFEYYKSSAITPEQEEVKRHTVYSRIHPDHRDWTDPAGAHSAAYHWYMLSIQYEYYAYRTNWFGLDRNGRDGLAPSAGLTNEKLRALESCNCWFEQYGGKETAKVDDDTFGRHGK